MHLRRSFASFLVVGSLACASHKAAPTPAVQPPPAVAQGSGVPMAPKHPKTTTLHGKTLTDDFFWLREKENPEVITYLKEENAYSETVLKPHAALTEKLYQEMVGHVKEDDQNAPVRYPDGYWYYSRVESGKQYKILCRRKGDMKAPEQVLLDLNALGKNEKFISLHSFRVTDDGRWLAYALDTTGYRQFVLHVKDLQTNQDGPEKIDRVDTFEWARDNKTLLYATEDAVSKRQNQMFRHVRGAVGQDPLVYEEKDEHFELYIQRTRSMRYFLRSSASHTTSEVAYLDASKPEGTFKVVEPRRQDHMYDLDHRGDLFYIRTNLKGRNFSVMTAPVSSPGQRSWKELVPYRPDVMVEGIDLFQDFYVLAEREKAMPQLVVTGFKAKKSEHIAVPDATYSLNPDDNPDFHAHAFRYQYESFVVPPTVFSYDVATHASAVLKREEIPGYDASKYTTELQWATGRDGTKIPVSLVYKKDFVKDGHGPLYLYGYGSYGISESANFSADRLVLLDRGVAYAMAHIRGGGELGKPWHDAGRMLNKRNTFNDFIDVAQWLVAQKYTEPSRLVAEGGSAGGLLMGAIANQRPDLFKAIIAKVPFVDVINTMLDESLPETVGEFEEWGNPKKLDEYTYMASYSPYDNVEKKAYPALLVKSSLNDSQVGYWEPAKWVAKLRTLKTDQNPLLLVMNLQPAGHGGQSGRFNRLRERAVDDTFALWQLGVAK